MRHYPIFGALGEPNSPERAEHLKDLRKGQKETASDEVSCTVCGAPEPKHDGWYALPRMDMEVLVCGVTCAGELALEQRPNTHDDSSSLVGEATPPALQEASGVCSKCNEPRPNFNGASCTQCGFGFPF